MKIHVPLFIAGAALAAALPAFATTLSTQDKTFADMAAQGGMAEVSDAKLALKNSHDPAVTAFAQKMIADHTKANAKLASVAEAKGLTLPAGVGPKHAAMHASLASLHGAAFDKTYLSQQKAGHTMMASLMETEASGGSDADLVAFAKATLPTVKMHLMLVEKDQHSAM